MNETFSLTLEQLDTVNLSLEKALAIAQLVGRPVSDESPPASLFVVMQIVVEELERIVGIMKGLEREE